jgi:uncharacterized protein (DUF2249 family)/hemerythrin-like domain-containing protein
MLSRGRLLRIRDEGRIALEAHELDVRTLPPRERHPLIFTTFDRLAAGEAFVLVNDHDPQPLFYQFQAERSGQVHWEPLETGPERWTVRIEKIGRVEQLAPSDGLPTQPLRDEHRELLPHIDELRALGDAVGSAREEDVRARLAGVIDFLQQHLLVHAGAEERVLYPTVARLMGAPRATATMSRDHVEVQRLTAGLAAMQTAIGIGGADAAQTAELRRLAYGLHALVTVHFAKEEEVYLPLLDAHLSAHEARELFAAMEGAAEEARRAR